jgi:endoglucanase
MVLTNARRRVVRGRTCTTTVTGLPRDKSRADLEAGGTAATSAACGEALPYWDAAKSAASLDLDWDNMAVAAALLLHEMGAGGATYVDSYQNFVQRLLER